MNTNVRDIAPRTYFSDIFAFTTSKNISIVIAPNNFGKTYLLNRIKQYSPNNCIDYGYTPKGIFEKYFEKYFPESKYGYGDGLKAVAKICIDLAEQTNPIVLNNPENFLHIDIQEVLVDAIVDLYGDTDMQVFIETQSPHIVSGYFDLICDGDRIDDLRKEY